ncbi:ABC transporter substrate-binding protein [Oryzibacter oryziterrae]|uniref:ABC transporter substrate-binding protein n=1 Tax=Oryzibacter oryziterrae TaxID=2766474 RepID=UPI001F3ACA67|nr:extracellular solute-binding protein [Oryzibacter oryziterrae]
MKKLSKLALVLAAVTALGAVSAEAKTFKVWWYEPADGALGIAWQAALDSFKKSHPDVDVKFELKTFDQINQAGSMILNSSEAPDVLEYNKGNGTAGLAASQGLLQAMDDEYKARGWDKLVPESALALGRYDENGVFGTGPLVGMPNYGEFVSVFYNEDMLKARGLEVPKTFEEFETVLGKFAAEGITPIAEAANDYPAQHLMYMLALKNADANWISNFEGLKAPLDTAPFVAAGKTIQDWVAKGYISKDSTGMTADDMTNQFMAGKSPFVVGGTWLSTSYGNIKTFHAGQFLFPGQQYAPGSTGNMWVVPANAQNKDLAYDFIGITLSSDIQTLMGNKGGLPIAADTAAITDPVGKLTTSLFKDLVARNGLGFYPDWPVAGFYNEVLQATQALVGGTATPEEFAARLKTFYDEGLNK